MTGIDSAAGKGMNRVAGRSTPEVVAVAMYSAVVALPFAALIPMLPTVGVPIAVGVTAALLWLLLARGRERVTILRGAAIGALVGAAFHIVFSVAYGLYAVLIGSVDEGFLDAMAGSLKMAIVTTVFGSVVSVPVGILAFVIYVGLLRPRFFPLGG